MVMYLSRLFSAPAPPSQVIQQPSNSTNEINDEAGIVDEADLESQSQSQSQSQVQSPPGQAATPQRATAAAEPEPALSLAPPANASASAEAVPQFTVLTISNLLAQNSNLLAQNLEMSRQVERLREGDMERIKQELRAEIMVELRAEMQEALGKAVGGITKALDDLQPTPRPTPPAPPASLGRNHFHEEMRDLTEMDEDQMGLGMMNNDLEMQDDESDEDTGWSVDKGKDKEVDQSQGVDPNALRLGGPSFMAMDASSEAGNGSVDGARLSAIAQHALEMEDDVAAGNVEMDHVEMDHVETDNVEVDNTGKDLAHGSPSPPVDSSTEQLSPTTPPAGPSTQTRRALRVSASQPDYRSYPIDQVLKGSSKKSTPTGSQAKVVKTPKSAGKNKDKSKVTSGKKRKSAPGPSEDKPRRQRNYNGRASLNARALAPSNGVPRGEGIWPPKGENTVKGNMQEIACDICNGRVHWACAGFEDETIAPDEWECPDCVVKIAQGVHPALIEKRAVDMCMRPTCIRKEKKKIVVKEGDEEEFYVEKYIGRRRAVGRRPNENIRVFEYLVKWLGYSTDVSTWEHESKLPDPHYADNFLRDCKRYGIATKPRVAMLPEARRWFDSNGNVIDSEDEGDDEEEEDVTPTPAVIDRNTNNDDEPGHDEIIVEDMEKTDEVGPSDEQAFDYDGEDRHRKRSIDEADEIEDE